MSSLRLFVSLVFGLLFAGLTVIARAQATPPITPADLVLRFDPSAAALDQTSIRAAIAQELAMTLADDGSDQAATLIVSVTTSGDVQLTYRPSREVLTRSVPITNTSDVPRLLAQLAGNLVRDEASALIAELQPAPTATTATPATTIPTNATSTRRASLTATPTLPHDTATPYLDNAWIFSVLGGGGMSLADDDPAFGNLVLQLSKRFDRVEIGVGARFAYGNMPIVARPVGDDQGIFAFSDVAIGYQVTLPVSVEYRVLGAHNAYLQLGVATGLRLAGFMNQSRSVASGSAPYLMIGVQATTGFALAKNHGVMLRVGWDLLPVSHKIANGEGTYELAPLPFGVQLGWQIGW